MALIGISQLFFAQVIFNPFATGFNQPIEITTAPNSTDIYIVEQRGKIKVLNQAGNLLNNYFVDLSHRVSQSGNEKGLLGLAFSPNYATDGIFYVNYTRAGDDSTVIARFHRNAMDTLKGDSLSEEIVLTMHQPFSNHNGGSIHFGPDNYLYIGMGDGGDSGDPQNRAQNTLSLLGKMLRIDVSGSGSYSIPPSNPHVNNALFLPEIWAIGLRNPWKFSFDQQNGDLWIADVGQNEWEEINLQKANSIGGENYGWRCYEGLEEFNTSSGCQTVSNYDMPIHVYAHEGDACSVTGGYVYRGGNSNLNGKYIFGDYCSKNVYYLDEGMPGIFASHFIATASGNITSFGQMKDGELLLAVQGGTIYKLDLTTVSLKENTLINSINLYPSLVEEHFTISFDKMMDESAMVQIIDVNGKIWMNTTIPQTSVSQQFSMDGLSAGVYLVHVQLGNKYFTTKVIKK